MCTQYMLLKAKFAIIGLNTGKVSKIEMQKSMQSLTVIGPLYPKYNL